MFDPTEYCKIVVISGIQYVTVDPDIMYPAVIARIRDILDNRIAIPDELRQERVNDAGFVEVVIDRAKYLRNAAAAVPPQVWSNALKPRSEFSRYLTYQPVKNRAPLELYADVYRDDLSVINKRGDALEIALGWFLQALRCKIGGSNVHILRSVHYNV